MVSSEQSWEEPGIYRDLLIAMYEQLTHRSLVRPMFTVPTIARKFEEYVSLPISATRYLPGTLLPTTIVLPPHHPTPLFLSNFPNSSTPSTIMADSGRTVWTADTHLDLLQAVMSNITLTDSDWVKISADLRAKGWNFTQNAALYGFCPALSTFPSQQAPYPSNPVST